MRNCASGNLEIPDRRFAPSGMTSRLRRCVTSSRRDHGAPDRPTAPSAASPPARCRD
jgi:hypothetical protein